MKQGKEGQTMVTQSKLEEFLDSPLWVPPINVHLSCVSRDMLHLIHKDQLQSHNSDEGLSSFTKI